MSLSTHAELLRYQELLHGLALRLVRNEDEAADLVQETSAAYLAASPAEVRSTAAWLTAVAKRLAARSRRTAMRRADREFLAARPEWVGADLERIDEELDAKLKLLKLVRGLPDRYREVVILRYDRGLSPKEIAAALGTSKDTVTSRLRRARHLLREQLDEAHGGDRRAWMLALAVPRKPAAALSLTGWVAVLGLLATGAVGVWALSGLGASTSDRGHTVARLEAPEAVPLKTAEVARVPEPLSVPAGPAPPPAVPSSAEPAGLLQPATKKGLDMKLAALATLTFALPATAAQGGLVLYVDQDATGAATGADWDNAFLDLQDALDAADQMPTVTDIRVAGGTYVPTKRTHAGNPRTATFNIRHFLHVWGSYAGAGAADPDYRDLALHPTVLTGDLNGDDVGTANQSENAFRVVLFEEVGTPTTLDGCVITAGRADGNWLFRRGGGVSVRDSAALVQNCILSGNYALTGGGAINIDGAFDTGYGFELNTSIESSLFVNNVTETGNGGAVRSTGNLTATSCRFIGNRSPEGSGGGVFSTNSVAVGSCEFSLNVAANSGGGLAGQFIWITGSTFVGNVADIGGGISATEGSILNSILWGNEGLSTPPFQDQLAANLEVLGVANSCIQDWTSGGPGNLDVDPRFVKPEPTAGGLDVDLRLLPGSPCIDAGSNSSYPLFGPDVAGRPRFQDDPLTADTGSGGPPTIDMGANEYDPILPGTAVCFGDGTGASCPCGNTGGAGEGCAHSEGIGMQVYGFGSTSIAADDLMLVVKQAPAGNSGLFFGSPVALSTGTPFGDGLLCVGVGAARRFQATFQETGTVTDTGFVGQDTSGNFFQPATEYLFQFWTRDAAGAGSPCSTFANLSPAYRVMMTP